MVKTCNGPCEQGRKECPTPWACEREEKPYSDPRWYYLPEFIVAALMVGALVFSWWVSR